MAVLSGLTKDSVLKALAEIDAVGSYDKRNEPTKYFLIYEGRRYPPKVAVSIAYRIQYGKELPVSEFSGGERRANLVLRKLGFEIVEIDDIDSKGSGKWLAVTTEENWKRCLEDGTWGASDNRSQGLKRMKRGDEMVVYIRTIKVAGIFKMTRDYYYDATKKWKDGMFPHRIGFSPTEKVPISFIDIRTMFYEYIKPIITRRSKEGSPRGYFGMGIRPLPQEEFDLFEREIMKYTERANANGHSTHHHYVTGYDSDNLQISKDRRILGWRDKPSAISIGDEVFVYNSTTKNIDIVFSVRSKSESMGLI